MTIFYKPFAIVNKDPHVTTPAPVSYCTVLEYTLWEGRRDSLIDEELSA